MGIIKTNFIFALISEVNLIFKKPVNQQTEALKDFLQEDDKGLHGVTINKCSNQ